MVFDVESVGLHGEGFAVGYVVIDGDSYYDELDSGLIAAPPDVALGLSRDREWVEEHVVPALAEGCGFPRRNTRCTYVSGVRHEFWNAWMHWRAQGATLAADCPWPVEARFLAACVDEAREARAALGPYPLIDVASVRLATGLDPLATEGRLPTEFPAHHPLADARQSARLLLEALSKRG